MMNETVEPPSANAPWFLEHLINNLLVLALLYGFDHLLLKPWITARIHAGKKSDSERKQASDTALARWFFVHSFANLLVCITSLASIRAVFDDPVHALDADVFNDASLFGNSSPWPLTIINSVHIYHMIGGFRLSGADYFHHLVFIPTIAFPGQVYQWGALGNFQAFWISGLPGGIDYCMLGLQKVAMLHGMTEKRINANLNTWLRTPGILTSTVLLYQALKLGRYQVPLWAALLQLFLPPYNALYFGKQATANYAVHYMLNLLGQDELIKGRIEQRKSCTTGTEVMAWKDALGVPQRGS